MKFTLVPDFVFDKFNDLTPQMLKSLGIKGVLLDIDNTLEPYENPMPGEHVVSWLSALKEQGIGCAFVSNNGKERVELFNSELGLPAYYKAAKPFKKNLVAAMDKLGVKPCETVMMGDQILTDVWAARNAGVLAAVVPPINDKKDPFTRFKRLLERPIMRKYRKIHKGGQI